MKTCISLVEIIASMYFYTIETLKLLVSGKNFVLVIAAITFDAVVGRKHFPRDSVIITVLMV